MDILKRQFEQVDNAPLILFRMAFGLLIFLESVGAIFTGWVRNALIAPAYNFTLIGLEWLQPPDGYFMYGYFATMGLCGLGVMLGYRYKTSIGLFTILWILVYWMQKTHYNNHYYLLILLCLFMLSVPANAYCSLDAKRSSSKVSLTCPRWCLSIFIIQLWIVYSFAAIHKFYPGWLNGDFIAMNLGGKKNYWLIGDLLQNELLQQMVVYGGILFDGTIIYFLLFKKTRKAAFIISIFFHLFNSVVFQIGIFPYLMIASCVFFFDPNSVRKTFFKKKPAINFSQNSTVQFSKKHYAIMLVFGLYFAHQIYLPLRHHLYKGDVFYTEEGHRLSWRMMLRYKQGTLTFKVHSPANDSTWLVNPRHFVSIRQARSMAGKPDMIWQMAQYLDKQYAIQGIEDVEVRAESFVRLNRGEKVRLIDENIDLTKVKWQPFKHSEWILSPN